jgi:hypothetical protein
MSKGKPMMMAPGVRKGSPDHGNYGHYGKILAYTATKSVPAQLGGHFGDQSSILDDTNAMMNQSQNKTVYHTTTARDVNLS